jgi:hypothetical protein
MGGRGATLSAGLAYSNVVFSAAILIWVFNSLANVVRGTGNMMVPAIVTLVGVAALIPLSPCLILGWGPFPRLGVAGGAVAVIALSGRALRLRPICGRGGVLFDPTCAAWVCAGSCSATSCESSWSRR